MLKNGAVWLEDPLHSSYPPSIAFKAAQIQSKEKAIQFQRVLREMVFLKKNNITKWEHISSAAQKVGLDTTRLKQDIALDGEKAFQEDLALAKSMGVRGFPTLIVSNASGQSERVYGFKPYDAFEKALKNMLPSIEKRPYSRNWKELFAIYPTLTTREFAELSDLSIVEGESQLHKLTQEQKLMKTNSKNGPIWSIMP